MTPRQTTVRPNGSATSSLPMSMAPPVPLYRTFHTVLLLLLNGSRSLHCSSLFPAPSYPCIVYSRPFYDSLASGFDCALKITADEFSLTLYA